MTKRTNKALKDFQMYFNARQQQRQYLEKEYYFLDNTTLQEMEDSLDPIQIKAIEDLFTIVNALGNQTYKHLKYQQSYKKKGGDK